MTDQPRALAYAIIRDDEGEITDPAPRDVYRVDSDVTDTPMSDAEALYYARDVATTRNVRDGEAPWVWRVVALVPVPREYAGAPCGRCGWHTIEHDGQDGHPYRCAHCGEPTDAHGTSVATHAPH